jgi:hypothetical protein
MDLTANFDPWRRRPRSQTPLDSPHPGHRVWPLLNVFVALHNLIIAKIYKDNGRAYVVQVA